MTRFILIRHAHTDAVGHVLAGRAPGFDLNVEGEAAAARVASALSEKPAITRLLTSPRERARQTAGQIARMIGCPAEDHDALDEVDFGDWTARRFGELESTPGWAEWNTLRSFSPTFGGETMLHVQARIVGLVQSIHAQQPGTSCVLVSHSDVIKALLSYALGTPLDLMQRMEVEPASMSAITLYDRDVRVEFVNRAP